VATYVLRSDRETHVVLPVLRPSFAFLVPDDILADPRTSTALSEAAAAEVHESAPKTDSGARTTSLDRASTAHLKTHLARQAADRLSWGEGWIETGRVFTRENGAWLHPALLSDYFGRILSDADLPPIRLHDLRHGAATLALAAGADMKHVQDMLGHSSYTITADTYTSVLPDIARTFANAALDLVPRHTPRTTTVRTEPTCSKRVRFRAV
jgi:integrase